MATGVLTENDQVRSTLRWDLLEVQPPSGERLTVRVAVPGRHPDVLIALDSALRRYVLVELPGSEGGEITERFSRGIAVSSVELNTDKRRATQFIEIACLDAQGHSALDTIAVEIVDALDAGASIGRIQLVQNVLAKWRRFWASVPQGYMSSEQQLGLFGELWFMGKWLVPDVGISGAINMWRGPSGARNDFEMPGLAVEAKTTGRVDGSHIIHGLDQLLEPPGGQLMLFSLLVRDEASGTESLPALVAYVRGLIGDDHALQSRFDSLLYAAGYDDRCVAEYAKTMLRIRSEALYQVREGFPRLIPSNIAGGMPPGVGMVEYELRLDSAASWLLASVPRAAKGLFRAH